MTKLTLVRVENPLAPTNCERSEVSFTPGQTVADLVANLDGKFYVTLNGRVLEKEEWADVCPLDGDYLVTIPMLEGGGGGDGNSSSKNVLRIIAMIVVVYLSQGAASGAVSGWGLSGATATFVQAGLTVAFTAAGAALVNALLPPPSMRRRDTDENPSYGVDGAKNTSAEGLPVPLTYGTFRVGGNIINNYVVNDENTQILYMLVNAGEGPIAGISKVEINEQPLENWQDVGVKPEFRPVVQTRNGDPDQEPIEWFPNTIAPENVGQEIINSWKTVSIGAPISDVYDQVRIDIVAPNGLYNQNNRGELFVVTVPILIEYRLQGSTTWQPLLSQMGEGTFSEDWEWSSWVNPAERDPAFFGPPDPNDADQYGNTIGYYDESNGNRRWYVAATKGRFFVGGNGQINVNGQQRTPLRRSYISVVLPQGAYEFRYQRTTPKSTDVNTQDSIYITDINKIISERVAYRNTALVALKVRLSDQLNGIPRLTYLHHGKIIKVYDEATQAWIQRPSSNPAWITWDILTNKLYGAGCSESRLNFQRWREWAAWCDEEGLSFNGSFDTTSNIWDAISIVSRCGRAQVVPVGTRYSILIERPEAPVQMFSVANIIQGTFKESWTSMDDRANEVEVSYFDKNDGYRQRTIKVYDAAAYAAGAPPRSASVTLQGVTSSEEAYKEAWLMLNLNRYIQRSIEFAAPLDAIACQLGSVILVQHDMPAWGDGGRLESGSTTTTLVLDRPVRMVGGGTYQVLLHQDSVVRHTGTVTAVSGDAIFISGYTGATNVRRLVVNGKDLEVQSIVSNNTSYGVIVESTVGVTVGATAVLHDTNVMVTRDVVVPGGIRGGITETATITISSPLPNAPEIYTKWLFGPVQKTCKPFRVTRIGGSGDYRRDITAIEYNESIYDAATAGPTPNYSTNNPRLVQPVTIDGVYEDNIGRDAFVESNVTVAWTSTQSTYRYATLYVARGGSETYFPVGQDKSRVTIVANREETLKFKVVPTDQFGNSGSLFDAASATYTVTGNTRRPQTVGTLTPRLAADGWVLEWPQPTDADWNRTQVRKGATWAGGVTVFDEKGTRTPSLGFLQAGLHVYTAKHFSHAGLESLNATTANLTIQNPTAAVFQAAERRSGSVTVRWSDCATSQPIKQYVIRVGTTSQAYATLTDYARVAGNSLAQTLTFDNTGTKRIWVVAEDMAGNVGSPAFIDVAITASAATSVSLIATSQIFQIDALGNNTPGSITLTATPTGSIASATPTWSTSPSITLGGSATSNVRTLPFANMGANNAVTVTVSYTDGVDTFQDIVTIVKLRDGVNGVAGDAIVMILDNEAHLIPCDAAGTPIVGAFTGATTAIKVFRGLVDDTSNWTFALNAVNVSVSASGTAVNPVVSVTAITADSGYVDITATRVGGGYPTYNKRFSLAKAKTGATATSTARVSLYQWSLNQPSTNPSGSSTYTWANGSHTGYTGGGGWQATIPANPGNVNWRLWEASKSVTDNTSATTSTVSWASGYSIAAISSNGSQGDQGPQGNSRRIAYTVVSGGTTLLSTPAFVTVSDLPTTGTWGAGEVWTAVMPGYSTNQAIWISEGIFNSLTAQTTWFAPYLSSFRVGQLSAITADLGTITAGSMTIGGRFAVTNQGYLTARGITIMDEAGNVILSTRSGSSVNLPHQYITPNPGWLNSAINITAGGALTGGTAADGRVIANDRILVNSLGILEGIGSSGVAVDNSRVGATNMLWGAANGVIAAGPGVYGLNVANLKLGTNNRHSLQPGETLTVSGEVWADATAQAAGQNSTVFLYVADSAGLWWAQAPITNDNGNPTRKSASVTLPSDPNRMHEVGVGVYHQGGAATTTPIGTVYVSRCQVERGPVATEYKPGFEPGATVGANWTTNVTGRPADNQILNSFAPIGQNLIPNSDQTSAITFNSIATGWNPNGAVFAYDISYAKNYWDTSSYALPGNTTQNVFLLQINRTAGGNSAVAIDMYPLGGWSEQHSIPVVPGQKYCMSAYLQGHRCGGGVGMAFFNSAGTTIASYESEYDELPYGLANALSQYSRRFAIGVAPTGSSYARLFVRKLNTTIGNSDSYMWIAGPQFEAVGADAQGPSPYVAGPPASTRQLGYTGDLNATFGATAAQATDINNARDLINGGGTNGALNNDPYLRVPTQWDNGNHGPTADFITVSDGPAGDRALVGRIQSAEAKIGVAVTAGRRYRMSATVRPINGANGGFYLRYVRKNRDNVTLSQHTIGIEYVVPPINQWTTYSADFIATADDKYVAPRVILNWDGTVGQHQVQDIRIVDVTDSYNLQQQLNQKLNRNANDVLSATLSIAATAGAGFVAGSLMWNSLGQPTSGYGVAFTPGGIVGVNVAGQTTFSINATTGAATFRGDITGSTGTFTGNLVVGTAARAGSSMTGAGAIFNAGGDWSIGTAAKNITFNGSDIVINGPVVNESNLNLGAYSATIGGGGAISVSTWEINTTLFMGNRSVIVSGGTAPYTYTWTLEITGEIGGQIFIGSAATNNNVDIVGRLTVGGGGGYASGLLYCTVLDAQGRSARTPAIDVSISGLA